MAIYSLSRHCFKVDLAVENQFNSSYHAQVLLVKYKIFVALQ